MFVGESFDFYRRQVEKLHWEFVHASKERLISLVRDSRVFHDKEFLHLIKVVIDSCSVCLKFRRPLL